MNTLEYVAAFFGVVSVYLSVRQNIWSWPTAIVNVGLYTFVFHASRLYADMGLQVIYVIVSFYGWYQWLYGGKNRTELKVSRTPPKLAVILVCIGVSFALLLGTVLHRTTNAALPYLDSLTTSTSLVAQWMMTKKLLENWIVWVAVDVVYIGMFISRALYPTAGLYLVFLVLSVMGYRQWRASLSGRDVASAQAA
ncbi:MAG TPA: nicotinamide riboside transporter PnuC [Gemmatimonadaceae bacterium]|nr:nicotinamide riboside transporter PnuC [Gemmatimonadaceae bacterium]